MPLDPFDRLGCPLRRRLFRPGRLGQLYRTGELPVFRLSAVRERKVVAIAGEGNVELKRVIFPTHVLCFRCAEKFATTVTCCPDS